jgi:hypothetical protein
VIKNLVRGRGRDDHAAVRVEDRDATPCAGWVMVGERAAIEIRADEDSA